MKKTILMLVLAVTITACGNMSNFGSGKIVTEERSVGNFDSVYVRGEGTVYLTQGEEISVVVETDDNLIRKVYTEVKGGTLELRYASGLFGTHLRPTGGYIYHVTVPNLESITISGSAGVFADGVVIERLDLDVTGSGRVAIDDLKADEVNATITGSGTITLSGEADTQRVSVTGDGIFDGRDLEGKYVRVNNKGSGKTTVWATEALDVSVEGDGEVHYYGDVEPDVSSTGSSKVQSLGNR
jgi:hypothetical protein